MEDIVEKPPTQRIRIEQHSAIGMLWFGAWLFTIGFLRLSFWKGVLALGWFGRTTSGSRSLRYWGTDLSRAFALAIVPVTVPSGCPLPVTARFPRKTGRTAPARCSPAAVR